MHTFLLGAHVLWISVCLLSLPPLCLDSFLCLLPLIIPFTTLLSLISVLSIAAKATTLFSRHTKSIVWGMQTRAVQGMLDFDYVCSRSEPSVAAMVYPFT